MAAGIASTRGSSNMPATTRARAIAAILVSYAANALLVGISEMFLSRVFATTANSPTRSYYIVDLISQCVYGGIIGYICRIIARGPSRLAIGGLIALGLVIGSISVQASWNAEPHWYAVTLLAIYAPCVWLGWALRGRDQVAQ